MNEHEKHVIKLASGKQKKSCCKLSKQFVTARGDEQHTPSRMTVYRYRKSLNMKPFHVIKKPLKTLQQCENRLWFCDFLINWEEDDFAHVVC